jgi:hypothetical protein
MPSFNPFRNMSYFFSSALMSSRKYLYNWMNELRFIHRHAALFQVSELLLQLHSATWHIVGTETSLKLIPHNRIDVYMSVAACLPPICCCHKELVRGKKNFLVICALGDHEILLYPLKPILNFHGFLSLREGGGASSQELSNQDW